MRNQNTLGGLPADYRRRLFDRRRTLRAGAVKLLRPKLTPADDKPRATLEAMEKWDGRVNAESSAAAMVGQMRLAFGSKILTSALGPDLVRGFRWSNFDTTLDRILKEQPAEWLPKEFASYADLMRASYDDARALMTRNLGADESKWTWGDWAKARFPHPLSSAPLIGAQFTVPANAARMGPLRIVGATVNVGAAVSMRLIADPSDWDKTQMQIALSG